MSQKIDDLAEKALERIRKRVNRRTKSALMRIRLMYAAAMMNLGIEPDGQYRMNFNEER